MPGGHVQRGDAGSSASAPRSNPDPRATGTRNRRTPTAATERNGGSSPRSQSALQQIGKALIPALAGRRRDPQDGARAAAQPGHHRRLAPALACEDPGARRQIENRQLQSPSPRRSAAPGRCTSVRLFTFTLSLPRRNPNISASDDSPSRIRMAPPFTRRIPFRRSRRAGPRHEHVRHPGRLLLQADGGKNRGPGPGVSGENREIGQSGRPDRPGRQEHAPSNG